MTGPVFARKLRELRHRVGQWKASGLAVGLVPTMGALHDGHYALVRQARSLTDRVVVSIFVNPTQFAAGEDLSSYPRTEDSDVAGLTSVAADLIYMPDVEEIYPPGFSTTVSLAGPATCGLEDRFRPTHFAGVATVVSKLLIQSLADHAVFGEKDYQQLAVVRRLVRDLDLPVNIVGAPTVRESDGLAMSSRNRYLTEEERTRAPMLYRTLSRCARAITLGEEPATALRAAIDALTEAGMTIDYVELRDSLTLEPLDGASRHPARLLAAIRLGNTRLIDNIEVRPVSG